MQRQPLRGDAGVPVLDRCSCPGGLVSVAVLSAETSDMAEHLPLPMAHAWCDLFTVTPAARENAGCVLTVL